MSEFYVAAIDLGSYKVIGAVARKSETGMEIIDIEKERTEEGCIEKGELKSIDKAALHINRLVQKLKNGAQLKELNYVYVTWHGIKPTDDSQDKLMKKVLKNVILKYPDKSNDILIASLFTTAEEMRNGVLAIDFGDTYTSFSYINDSSVSYESSLPGGSRIITTDLQTLFDFPFKIAENLKLMFGKALPTEGADQIVSLDKDNTKTIRVSELSKEILKRVEDIFKRVIRNMVTTQWNSNKNRMILLAGGGSRLPYLDKLLSRQTGLEVRMAKFKDGFLLGDKASSMQGPEYAPILALLNHASEACDTPRPNNSSIRKLVKGIFSSGAETGTQKSFNFFTVSEENEKM